MIISRITTIMPKTQAPAGKPATNDVVPAGVGVGVVVVPVGFTAAAVVPYELQYDSVPGNVAVIWYCALSGGVHWKTKFPSQSALMVAMSVAAPPSLAAEIFTGTPVPPTSDGRGCCKCMYSIHCDM